MPPQWNQRAPSPREDAVPVDVAGAQLGRRGVAAVGAARRRRGGRSPRSVKFSPFRTWRPTPSNGTQLTCDMVDAALEHQVLDEPADGVVREGGDDGRPHAEAAPQAARHVVLAAALPGAERAAWSRCAPRPGPAGASPRPGRPGPSAPRPPGGPPARSCGTRRRGSLRVADPSHDRHRLARQPFDRPEIARPRSLRLAQPGPAARRDGLERQVVGQVLDRHPPVGRNASSGRVRRRP